MRTLILILLFSVINNICFTQGNVDISDRKNIYDEKGDYYFNKKEYKKSILYYNMAFNKDAKNYYSILRKAEAYTKLELFPQAAECYRIVFEKKLRISNIYRLHYAFVLQANNNIRGFEEWLSLYSGIIESEIKGKNYISTEENRVKLYKDSTIIIVSNLKKINTKESEINPVAYQEQIIFASTRNDLNASSGNKSYNILSASYLTNGELGKVKIFNNNLNTSENEGSICFFDVSNTMYFSRGDIQKSNLKTYTTNIPYESSDALDITKLSFANFSNIGHISLNSTGTTMFFASDASGGFGGVDIYSSNLINGEWDTPKNMGDGINTSRDDIYPFIFKDSILYFSSEGHNSFGGLDLFSANLNNENSPAHNLGAKINTEYNDYSLSFSQEGITGYFCSDRPGGAGKEDIYSLHILNLKIKYAAYRHKIRTSIEDDKINLHLSNGDEYNIASDGNDGFNFGFLPEEDYKMIIQHENIIAGEAINNKKLTIEQRKEEFLSPTPINEAEIQLQAGMKYQFAAGLNPISSQYSNSLNDLSNLYQDPTTSTIDLTALAKELQFTEGEIYTIQFIKDDSRYSGYKAKGESSLFINNEAIDIYGRSFFIVLPLNIEANFNIQTDIDYLKENFNPKKHGLIIDESSIFNDDIARQKILSMLINTDSADNVKVGNQFEGADISIIPGTEYILTLGKLDLFSGENIEIFVPLTKGVKYNLGSVDNSEDEYKKILAELVLGREVPKPLNNEEVIDISVLSKELEVQAGEELTFNLLPAKQFGVKNNSTEHIKSSLSIDGIVYDISRNENYSINIPFNSNHKVNIQTDLAYIQDNFEENAYFLNLDTIPFSFNLTVDTTGYGSEVSSNWLVSMSVNTDSSAEVLEQNHLMAKEVSIIPGREYILTVIKTDATTKKETEIIVPLTRKVKYDFTSNPALQGDYKVSFNEFLKEHEEFEVIDGEVIDISILSKALEIKEGDDVSFSLLPAKVFRKDLSKVEEIKSSLYLDNKVVKFTEIQKYTINIPLSTDGQVTIQTDIEHLQENFEPGSYTLDVDTVAFLFDMEVDTTGYGNRTIQDYEITDPVFDLIIVNFNLNAYSLSAEAKNTIESKVVNELNSDKRLYVTIKGYTDALGNADYNKKLSKDRAQSVKNFLANKGIGEGRIRTFSFGESQALNEGVNWEDLDESELKKHRKVEIVIYLPE